MVSKNSPHIDYFLSLLLDQLNGNILQSNMIYKLFDLAVHSSISMWKVIISFSQYFALQ
jgi:hypothetical protein